MYFILIMAIILFLSVSSVYFYYSLKEIQQDIDELYSMFFDSSIIEREQRKKEKKGRLINFDKNVL